MKRKNFKRGFLYRVRNKLSGRIYIGQQSRFYNKGLEPDEIMGKLYFTSNKTLAEEWKAHPEEFEWEVIKANITDKRELDWLEGALILDMWRMKVPCYNKLVNICIAKRKEDEP